MFHIKKIHCPNWAKHLTKMCFHVLHSTLLPVYLSIPLSLPPSRSLCPISLTYLLPPSYPPFFSYLPAAAPGLLALTALPQTKEWIEVPKKENKRQLWTPLFSVPLCLPHYLVTDSLSHSLSLCLSLCLTLFSVLSLRESSWALVSQSNGHSDHFVNSAWIIMAHLLTQVKTQNKIPSTTRDQVRLLRVYSSQVWFHSQGQRGL